MKYAKLISSTEHRPWPMPSTPWRMAMGWHDVCFTHWPVSSELITAHLPRGLELDTFDGQAWVGVVAFKMVGVHPRWLPTAGPLSNFPELNVRTYVTAEGRPGVWFVSLDATVALAIGLGRGFYHLPYYRAQIETVDEAGWTQFDSARPGTASRYAGRYRGTGELVRNQPGSLEHWLTERYCFYSSDKSGRVYRCETHHEPWPLQTASVDIEANTMLEPLGIPDGESPTYAHWAAGVDTISWGLTRVA